MARRDAGRGRGARREPPAGRHPDESCAGFSKTQEGDAGPSIARHARRPVRVVDVRRPLARQPAGGRGSARRCSSTKIRGAGGRAESAIGAELPPIIRAARGGRRSGAGCCARRSVGDWRRRLRDAAFSPRALLDRIAHGAVKVVAFDGTPAAGRAFVVSQFAPAAARPRRAAAIHDDRSAGPRRIRRPHADHVPHRRHRSGAADRAGHIAAAPQRRVDPALRAQRPSHPRRSPDPCRRGRSITST